MIGAQNHARRAVATLTLLTFVALAPRLARAQASTRGGSAAAASDPAPGSPALKLEPQLGAFQHKGDSVWYRLPPPFADPNFEPFAFEPQRNTGLALAEVVGINVLMWQVSYWAGNDFSKISTETIGQNFQKGWIVDTDPYWVNQFGHPLEGMLFYSAARSTGHDFYQSFAFSFLGSWIWEQFMEVQSPSVNDQITTPVGGTLLGEVLYRMHRLILDSGGGKPDFWHEAGAFLVNPVAGFNRLTSGDKYRGEMLLPASWWGQFHLGTVLGGSSSVQHGTEPAPSIGTWASVGAHVVYGVPGTPDLRLRQPLDHFDLDFAFAFAGQEEPVGELRLRGILLGDTIGRGEGGLGGLWGLFGSYDVTGVPVFKASGVGLGPGVSLAQRWDWFELQGSALGEVMPWATGGSMVALFARDYHNGPGAKGTLELRAHFADRVTLEAWAREYWISGAYATGSSEDMTYVRSTLTVRVYGPHAVSGVFTWGRRHASYHLEPEISENATIWSAYYTLLTGW
jgi:Domain of unknown function (DUF3943)